MNTTGAENVVATQATVGLFFSALLTYLKRAKWVSFVNDHSAAINHLWTVATSAVGALGVHAAWSASSHTLAITGLDLATIGASAWLWAKSYTIQVLVHKTMFGAISTPSIIPKA